MKIAKSVGFCLLLIANLNCSSSTNFSPLPIASTSAPASTSGDLPDSGSTGTCVETVNPLDCPLTGAFDCPAGDCGDSQISRYQALIMAYQYRGTSLCVLTQNRFPGDSGCTGGPGDDPSLCSPYLNGISARDCIDAAATNPFLTVGVSTTDFGQTQISEAQALTFAFRATIGSQCGATEITSLTSLPSSEITNRQAWLGYSGQLWPYLYSAVALNVVPAGSVSGADSALVSSSEMSSYFTGFALALQTTGDPSSVCNTIAQSIQNASP